MLKYLTPLFVILIFSAQSLVAQEDKTEIKRDSTKLIVKDDIIKTGYNFGPFPVVGFDADKGFGFGALLNIFDFGDGSTYPNTRQQWYLEASYYTKGTQLYVVSYDSQHLIPGVRTSIAGQVVVDNALSFTGFNGYQSYYDYERMDIGMNDENSSYYNPFYRVGRLMANFKADFTGKISDNGNFRWVAGYHFKWDKYSDMNIDSFNKGLDDQKKYDPNDPTLFGLYKEWGVIPEKLHEGGITSSIRAGLIYDTRDVENNASRGIWTEGHIIAAPSFLGSTESFYKYSLTFRHYVPLVAKRLTFAYRLNYQGTIGSSAPFYSMPYLTITGKGYDRDAIGGYHTVRGMLRNKVQGLDMGFYNAEIRWRFVDFSIWSQNIAFALNIFTDGAITTRSYNMDFKALPSDFDSQEKFDASFATYNKYMAKGMAKDDLHKTVGGGIRFIMNENFILAAEYGVPLSRQDGTPSFYLNTGYLF